MRALAALGFAVAIAACGTSGGGTIGGSGGGSGGGTGGSGSGGNSTGGTSGSGTGGNSSSGGGTSNGGGSTTTGGCAAALCGGNCCDASDSCVANACCPVAQACGSTCCEAGSGCVTDQAGNPACGVICEKSADCDGGECVPGVNDAGIITGPYTCAPDDGSSHAGCGGDGGACSVTNQYCSTDQEGNAFCSIVCGSDAVCGNPGVACCDTSCNFDEVCCGLCGS